MHAPKRTTRRQDAKIMLSLQPPRLQQARFHTPTCCIYAVLYPLAVIQQIEVGLGSRDRSLMRAHRIAFNLSILHARV